LLGGIAAQTDKEVIAYDLKVELVSTVIVVLVCRTFLKGDKQMKRITTTLLAIAFTLLPMSSVLGQEARHSFGFNSDTISGFPTGAASLTGGGAYNSATSFVRAGGSFKCTANIAQGPLNGCQAGEGVRWDAVALLANTTFKCTGAAGEALKTAVTDDNTVVMTADFYREGDGEEASFTAKMFVSAVDEASDFAGDQKVWIQGVGCGDAIANFN